MGNKKKKLIKYNQTIRKIFDGVGFDEGIARVPLDNLIELAMILSLKEHQLTKAELIKAFRRVWSNGDVADRALIVEYLKSLDTIFKSDKATVSQEVKLKKIDEILLDIEHTLSEEIAIKELFKDVKLKKITLKRIQDALIDLRNAKKRNSLEEKFDGSFDDDGDFHFFHSFSFKIFNEHFHKFFELKCRPFEDKKMLSLSEEELSKRLESCKKSAICKKEEEIGRFLEIALKPNRYLDSDQKLKAIKQIPQNCDFTSVPIPLEYLYEILLNQFNIENVEVLSDSLRLFKRVEKELFKNPKWRVVYRLMLEVKKRWLYQAIWKDEFLTIDKDFDKRRSEIEARFDIELNTLKDALMREAKGLEISDKEVEVIIADFVVDVVTQKEILEIPYKTLNRINRYFLRHIEGLKLKKQRKELLAKTIRDFKNLFPLARELGRKLIFHIGPTNSGKTYAAMKRLKEADTGYYLAPLRLLALEGYETLKSYGLKVSLITGEEQIIDEDAAHISSTIEMANFQIDVDVCVIDEVQMITDLDRGWAWANAIIGIPAKVVIMTGSKEALKAIQELANWLNEELEIVWFERKAPLILNSKPTSLKKLEPFTAIVAFSRYDVLVLKEQLSSRYNVSVVYGNLSPEVRREEARRFREGKSQILVATDAIAMGLNLPIKTILFARDTKFDGQNKRQLTPSEIRQIAGRAGRYGLHEVGFVGALSGAVLDTITKLIDKPSSTISGPYRVMANFDHIDLVAKIIETQSLSEILGFFVKHMQFDGPFVAANIENMLEIAKMVDFYDLDLKTKYHLSCAPLSLGSPYLETVFHRYLILLERQEPIPFNLPKLPQIAQTSKMLFEAEEMVKEVSLYLWLSYRFSNSFVDVDNALKARKMLNDFIERSLKEGVFTKVCRRCKKPLSFNFKFGICQECYHNGQKIFRYTRR